MRTRNARCAFVTCRPRATRWAVALALLFLAGACGAPSEPIAYNLVDYFAEATVVGTVEVEAPERTEWRFDGEGTIPAPEPPDEDEEDAESEEGEESEKPPEVDLGLDTYGWTVFNGVENLEIRDGMLTGTTVEQPVLMVELPDTLDENAYIYAIEIRMKVGEGDLLKVRTNNTADVATILEEERKDTLLGNFRRNPARLEAELAPGDTYNTYILTNVAISLPVANIRRLLIEPTDAEGTDFEIESVRITTLKEHLLSISSGPGWQGLSEIYRETIVSHSPEVISFDIAVPDRPWFEISYGTIEDGPVTFMIDIDEARLMERTVTTPRRWESLRIDLDDYAGRTVTLSLSLRSENPGMLGYWGTPILRSSNTMAAAGEMSEARRALADGGARRPQGVIFIIADTLRSDHLEPWGYERSTAPFLTQLASEGVRFADTISQGTWTKVSVPSILSSLYPTSNRISKVPDRLPSSVTIMPEVFNDAGYATLSTPSVYFTGRLTNLHQGVEVLHERASVSDLGHSSAKTARTFVDRLVPWLEDHRDAPFFVFLHVFDPHSPFEPYRPYDTAWAEPGAGEAHQQRIDTIREALDEDDQGRATLPYDIDVEAAGVDREAFIAHEEDWYDGSIRGMDAEIARLFEKLRELGLDDDTLLVFMSDHGEEFLEHGRHFHGNSAYGEMVNVPLFFRWPDVVPAGVVVDELVQLIDVMPTVLELAGLSVPEEAQGQSLIPLMADTPDLLGWVSRPAFSERRFGGFPDEEPDLPNIESLAVVVDGWKLIKNLNVPEGRSEFELYSHVDDPLNLHDVAADHPEIVQRLAAEIDTWQEWALAQQVEEDSADSIPPEELAKLRALGYIR
ncbi:MAG: sulfatase [Acidobacteria bacterium]|nr:sulfatase [Acidobacteriota bacterium]